MARGFTNASSQYLTQAAAVVPSMPFSVGGWFYDTNLGSTRVLWSAAAAAADNNYFAIWTSFTTSGHVAINARNTTDFAVESTTSYAGNTWHHVLAVFNSATDRRIYLDGGGKQTDANSSTPVPTRMALGALYRLTIANYMDGRLAEWAVWSAALSDDDAVSLAKTFAPPLVKPASLTAYWPLFGNDSPELDRWKSGLSLTLVNTPTKVEHAPTIYPTAGMVL